MSIFLLIIATVFILVWLILLFRVRDEDWIQAANVKVFDCRLMIRKLQEKDAGKLKDIIGNGSFTGFLIKKIRRDFERKVFKLEGEIIKLQKGNLKGVNILILPGYVLQREIVSAGKGNIHKNILSKCFELYGKKHAVLKTKQLLAKILSYSLIGTAASLMLGVIFLSIDNVTVGIAIIGFGTMLVLVLVYAMYDELGDLVLKRRSAIIRQFPGVVSKLALLVTSGMIMDRAWKETAYSGESDIYREMRKTSKELDNLVSPELAYANFISRCNTKESAKLASAIMQNLSKGNAEIGRLLKDMAREAWQERRHMAKRDAEKPNSKLMIPTMLLFLAILVMLMVPVAMNFSGI